MKKIIYVSFVFILGISYMSIASGCSSSSDTDGTFSSTSSSDEDNSIGRYALRRLTAQPQPVSQYSLRSHGELTQLAPLQEQTGTSVTLDAPSRAVNRMRFWIANRPVTCTTHLAPDIAQLMSELPAFDAPVWHSLDSLHRSALGQIGWWRQMPLQAASPADYVNDQENILIIHQDILPFFCRLSNPHLRAAVVLSIRNHENTGDATLRVAAKYLSDEDKPLIEEITEIIKKDGRIRPTL